MPPIKLLAVTCIKQPASTSGSMIAQRQHIAASQSFDHLVFNTDIGTRQYAQRNSAAIQLLLQSDRALADDIAGVVSVVSQLMRCHNDGRNAIVDGHFRHRQGFIPRLRTVVDFWDEVTMNVDEFVRACHIAPFACSRLK
jgi:hypothetical protein